MPAADKTSILDQRAMERPRRISARETSERALGDLPALEQWQMEMRARIIEGVITVPSANYDHIEVIKFNNPVFVDLKFVLG